MRIETCVLLIAASLPLAGQHGYTPSEIEGGQMIFQSTCSRCHGVEGDGVAGINLLRGQFRRVTSDAELMKVIQTGVPGTAMPPGNYTEVQAKRIVAYLRATAESAAANAPVSGDAARGKSIVEGKGGCLNCHSIGNAGSYFGPDLTDVGLLRTFAELQDSLLEPDKEVRVENRIARVTLRDGTVLTGKLLNQDGFSVQILTQKQGLLSLSRSELRDFAFLDKSPMPSYRTKLTPEELGDVVNYLHSLKGVENQ